MDHKFATVAREGHVTIVTIDRPEQRNALHSDAFFELAAIFDDYEADPEQWVAIITGAGDKAFCAGADLKGGIRDMPASGFAGLCTRFSLTKPVIAAVNGFALGGGFETALACDIIVAADTASFGLTEPRVGLAAMAGGPQRLVREIGYKRAMGMLLTGRRVPAAEGLALGFVNEVVPADALMAAARRWADEIVACSPMSIRATKQMTTAAAGQGIEPAIRGIFELPALQAMLRSEDVREGPRAFAEKRKPEWKNR